MNDGCIIFFLEMLLYGFYDMRKVGYGVACKMEREKQFETRRSWFKYAKCGVCAANIGGEKYFLG